MFYLLKGGARTRDPGVGDGRFECSIACLNRLGPVLELPGRLRGLGLRGLVIEHLFDNVGVIEGLQG